MKCENLFHLQYTKLTYSIRVRMILSLIMLEYNTKVILNNLVSNRLSNYESDQFVLLFRSLWPIAIVFRLSSSIVRRPLTFHMHFVIQITPKLTTVYIWRGTNMSKTWPFSTFWETVITVILFLDQSKIDNAHLGPKGKLHMKFQKDAFSTFSETAITRI